MTTKTKDKPTGLALLREPFPANQISKLPKPTKSQTDAVRADFKAGRRCTVCGGWHHPDVVHLDYVGHAALTDRLLDADINWDWEPLALTEQGLPLMDHIGGLWIKLTVCGMTRLGYGDADGKKGGNAVKEAIGDALRNASMRFGAALDLWHKGDLHADDDAVEYLPANEKGGMPKDALADLKKLMVAADIKEPAICKRFNVANLTLLSSDQYRECVEGLNNTLAQKAKQVTNTAANDYVDLDDAIPY